MRLISRRGAAKLALGAGLAAVAGRTSAQTLADPQSSAWQCADTDQCSEPEDRPSGLRLGLATHFMWHDLSSAASDLDRLQIGGMTVARFDLDWNRLEPRKGEWDEARLAKLDTILGLMHERGMVPIVVLIETPDWARDDDGSTKTPPENPADYAEAVGFLAARYAHHQQIAWEIWNEPNDPHTWRAHGGPSARAYTRLLQASYEAIKLAAPDATVLGGSLAFNDQRYLRKMYNYGAHGFFDGLAIHPYCPGRAPDDTGSRWHSFRLALEQMTETMADCGDPDKPIWITEMGWSSAHVDDLARAVYFQQAVDMARGWPSVRVFCAYTLNQRDYEQYGLITPDGAPTVSWTAYTHAATGAS
jgi:hypothetical protein